MASHQDVMVAFLGASAGIGGLTLVFLGLLGSTIQGYPSTTPAAVLKPFRDAAAAVVAVFGTSLLASALAATWLVAGHEATPLYVLAVAAFYVQLVGLVGAVVLVLRRTVWG